MDPLDVLLGIISAALIGALTGLASAALWWHKELRDLAAQKVYIAEERVRLARLWAALTPVERAQARLTYWQRMALTFWWAMATFKPSAIVGRDRSER